LASENGKSKGMPNVLAIATAHNYGRFAVGPLEVGYGGTLGNALRRILLSSLPGSAVTSIRIQNVYHEFSCIPYVREDVTQIVLNVKNMCLRSYSDRAVRLQLSKQGPGPVLAGDVELPANVELVNPELVLATLDSPEAFLEMELTVERGRGYASSDSRDGMPIGAIPVDAIFSPIPKVNYLIEPASAELLAGGTQEDLEAAERVEIDPASLRGLEQLVIEIWTDGTIDPGEALSMAGQYLAQHSSLIANFNRVVAPLPGRDLAGTASIPAHLFEIPIDELNLSMRTYNCLKRSGITKVGQVLTKDRKELLGLRNFGQKSLVELYQALSSRDLIPPGTPLDVPADVIFGTEEEGADEGGDDDVDVDYQSEDLDTDPEPEGYLAEPGMDEGEESVAVVDNLGVSEGSAAMSRGIYVDDEFAGEPIKDEDDAAPDTAENRQLDKGAEQGV
jgi:DNA-directed RNA polymerase subunit alpha